MVRWKALGHEQGGITAVDIFLDDDDDDEDDDDDDTEKISMSPAYG